jgi:hypothetical protein
MKGVINISISDEIQIYVKASNFQGTMEATIKRKNWNEILNKEIDIESFFRTITIQQYDLDQTLKIKMKMRKDTGMYHFDLELKNNGNNTYSAELGRLDIFTWQGIVLNLLCTPFLIIYNKISI